MKSLYLVGFTLILIAIGGWLYGEATSELPGERIRQTTTGQEAGIRKEEVTKRAAENEGGKANYGTNRQRTHALSGRVTAIEPKQGPIQTSMGSRKEDGGSLSTTEQGTASTNTAPSAGSHVPNGDKSSPSSRFYLGAFTITAYTAGYESTQKKKGEPGYGITATGTTVTEGRTIAADWTVLPPGTVVEIEGLHGQYTVEDRGGAVKGKHIDLYIQNLNEAKAWGRQTRSVQVITWGERR